MNALLTQLDRLKQHPNVLVMTTSNLTNAIGTIVHQSLLYTWLLMLASR